MSGRILIHMACPHARKTVANALAELTGRSDEHSIELQSLPGKPAAIWDGVKGYPQGKWWAASQSFAPAIAQALLTDGETKKPESFFVAYDEDTLTPIQTNCPAWPEDASFAAFVALIGCEIVDNSEPLP